MPTTSPLLIDLAGIARLAGVQRPVASVWRRRFATTKDPFPPAESESRGRALFDALAVARWLERTNRGNNKEAVADAAASATPGDFDVTDAAHVARIDALLALRSASSQSVGGLAADELQRLASEIDPGDDCLLAEIKDTSAVWASWADLLADAAYSNLGASRLLERQHEASRSSSGSSGPLARDAEALVIELAAALAVGLTTDERAEVLVNSGIRPSLAVELMERLGDGVDLIVEAGPEGRRIRRRHLCDGQPMPSASTTDVPRVTVARFPSGPGQDSMNILLAIEEIALGMREDDRVIVIAPAGVLIETVSPAEALARAETLRTGRVRTIVKLPAGLLTAAPREALALWTLGGRVPDVPIADRVTAVANLVDAGLSKVTGSRLISDIVAGMGSARDVMAHAFGFAQLVPSASLIASRRALVGNARARTRQAPASPDLPVLLDQAWAALGDDAPVVTTTTEPSASPGPASVEYLLTERHLRLRPGTRIASDEYYDSGYEVVGPDHLDDPSRIGDRHVDTIVFEARHSRARLTKPGDIIFRTAPTPKAWVDPDGSKAVLYPARVFRINSADPGGLVPEIVVADIAASTTGPGVWRRWRLRRVAPQEVRTLRHALVDLAARRADLARRVEALDTYTDLLCDGVATGAVTLSDPAAPKTSEK